MSQEHHNDFHTTRNSSQILPQLSRHTPLPTESSPLGFLDSFGISTRQNTKEDSYLTNYLPNPRATAPSLPYGLSDTQRISHDINNRCNNPKTNDSYSNSSNTGNTSSNTPLDYTLNQTESLLLRPTPLNQENSPYPTRCHDRHIHNQRLEQLGNLPNHHPFSTFSPHQARPIPLDTRFDYHHTDEDPPN